MPDERNGTAMVPHEEGAITTPLEAQQVLSRWERMQALDVQEQIDEIMKARLMLAKLVDLALKSTDEKHWDNFGGNPRLNAKGAKRVLGSTMLRVETFSSVRVEEDKDEAGRVSYFMYECRGRVTSPWGPPMDCVGRCDSANKFHGTRGKGENKRQIPAYEVNKVNIAQQAQTNCVTRGVSQYLGLEGLTWKEVKKYTNVRGEASRQVDFGSGGQAKPETPPPPDDDFMPQDDQPRNDPPRPDDATATDADIDNAKATAWRAGAAYDAVTWWEFVEKTIGKEKAIGPTDAHAPSESAAYQRWTRGDAKRVVAAARKEAK